MNGVPGSPGAPERPGDAPRRPVRPPDVSAVIVSWNSLAYLPGCMRSLERQEVPPREVVLVDNGSEDGTQSWVRQRHPEVRLIENRDNRGFSAANNQGIDSAAGDYILLVNTDVVLEAGFLGALSAALSSDPGLGWASGKLLRLEPGQAPGGGGQRIIDSTGDLVYRTRRSINRGQGEVDRGQYDRREEVFGVTAAAALYRREMLDDIRLGEDYFDTDYFSYMEDSDLNWRAQLRGWRCLYEPAAVGYHVRQHAGRRGVDIRRHAFANRYLNLWKNETLLNLLLAAPHLLAYESFRAVKILLRDREVLPGIGKLIRLLPRTLHKRRLIQRRRRVSSRYLRAWMVPEDYWGEFRRRCLPGRPERREAASGVAKSRLTEDSEPDGHGSQKLERAPASGR